MIFVTLKMMLDRWCGSWRRAGFFSKPTYCCPGPTFSLYVYTTISMVPALFSGKIGHFFIPISGHTAQWYLVWGRVWSRRVQLVNFDLGRNQISPFRYRSRSFWNNYSTTKWKIRKGQKCHGQASNPTWAGLVSSETPRTWTASTQKMSRSLSTRPRNYYLD